MNKKKYSEALKKFRRSSRERQKEFKNIVRTRSLSKKYERCLVAFIDLLGFKALIENSSVEKILEILGKKGELDLHRIWSGQGYPPKTWPITYNFSDLIVNVLPFANYKEHERFFLIFGFLSQIGALQASLVNRGVFVRGGITIGDIFADDRAVFGPALVRAYELESKISKWPIISIDPVSVEEIRSAASSFLEFRKSTNDNVPGAQMGVAQLGAFVRRTDEGIPFLDYLECMRFDDLTTGDFDYLLGDHREQVMAAYKAHKHYKYTFVAKYHDEKCRESEHSKLIIGDLEQLKPI